jgi:MscS family membrane protein
MDNFLDQIVLNNRIGSYLISAGIVVFVSVFRRLLAKGTAWLLARMLSTKTRTFDKKRLGEFVLAPLNLFLSILSLLIAAHRLNIPDILRFEIYRFSFEAFLHTIFSGLLIGSFAWLCNRIVVYISLLLQEQAAATLDRTDDQLIVFFRDFFQVIVWIMGGLLILKFSFGYNLSHVLTGLSIVGAALALAFRESLENLIASFVIFFDKPFTLGDLVKIDTITGTVERIGLRSTRIRTLEKTYVTVPNKKMVDSILDNITLRSQRNASTRLELSLDTRVEQINPFIADVEALLKEPPVLDYNVFFAETGGQANMIQIDYFTDINQPIKEFFQLRHRINIRLNELLLKHQLELAAKDNPLRIKSN